jgi:hypothetical protein
MNNILTLHNQSEQHLNYHLHSTQTFRKKI